MAVTWMEMITLILASAFGMYTLLNALSFRGLKVVAGISGFVLFATLAGVL